MAAILKDLSSQFVSHPDFSLQESVIIGRSSSCQLRYPSNSPSVSRHHARIFPLGSSWAIEDLGSRNGTFVNQQPVKDRVLLEPDSKIMLGWGGPELLFTTATANHNTRTASMVHSSGHTSPFSHTVLFPFASVRQDILEGGYLLPVGTTAISGVLIALANNTQNVSLAQLTFSLLACTLGCLGFYQLCNRRKPLPFVFLILFGMAVAAYGLISLHRSTCTATSRELWCSEAFTSIVAEELFKSIPILICLFVDGWFTGLWRKRLQIEEPLDGILIAGASATGLRLGQAISTSLGLTEFNLDLFFILLGLGPIAYSSLLGYCAGLFAPYARKLAHRRQKLALLLYGYAGALGLKAMKFGIDSLPEMGGWLVVSMGLTISYTLLCGYILYAYILKAKKLSERIARSRAIQTK